MVTGIGVLNRNPVARVVGVVAAGVSILTNVTFASAPRVYAVVVIALDVVFVYAIVLHGDEVH